MVENGDEVTVKFVNNDNTARKTGIDLKSGCDLSALAAAVAVQVYAVTG